MLQSSGLCPRCLAGRSLAESSHHKILTIRDHRRQRIGVSGTCCWRFERDARVRTVNFIASDSGLRVLPKNSDIQGRSNLVASSFPAPIAVASEKAPRNSTKTSVRSSANISPKIQEQSNA